MTPPITAWLGAAVPLVVVVVVVGIVTRVHVVVALTLTSDFMEPLENITSPHVLNTAVFEPYAISGPVLLARDHPVSIAFAVVLVPEDGTRSSHERILSWADRCHHSHCAAIIVHRQYPSRAAYPGRFALYFREIADTIILVPMVEVTSADGNHMIDYLSHDPNAIAHIRSGERNQAWDFYTSASSRIYFIVLALSNLFMTCIVIGWLWKETLIPAPKDSLIVTWTLFCLAIANLFQMIDNIQRGFFAIIEQLPLQVTVWLTPACSFCVFLAAVAVTFCMVRVNLHLQGRGPSIWTSTTSLIVSTCILITILVGLTGIPFLHLPPLFKSKRASKWFIWIAMFAVGLILILHAYLIRRTLNMIVHTIDRFQDRQVAHIQSEFARILFCAAAITIQSCIGLIRGWRSAFICEIHDGLLDLDTTGEVLRWIADMCNVVSSGFMSWAVISRSSSDDDERELNPAQASGHIQTAAFMIRHCDDDNQDRISQLLSRFHIFRRHDPSQRPPSTTPH